MSDDAVQDHVFVDIAINEMLSSCNVNDKVIVTKSDNCAKDYKCAAHFDKLQRIEDSYNTTLIRIYGVPGHGKGEVDHVGGIAKVKVRREVAAGNLLQYSNEMVGFISEKFRDKINPTYMFKRIVQRDHFKATRRSKISGTVKGL
jgi:hypothetical protein